MSWKSEDLWNKACLYFSRAFEVDREDPLFPLWSSLGLELLARAAVAKVHPVLLADPQQGENLLYACGFPSTAAPKSVPAKTVFHRLTVVLPGFSETDFKFCTALMEMRNAELHSGELPFDKYPATKWFPQLCRICKVLTGFCEKTLADLIGNEEAKAAEEAISALETKLHAEVNRLIKDAKTAFDELSVETRLENIKKAKDELVRHMDWKARKVKCPACEVQGILQGKILKMLNPRATGDGIEERAVIMPVKFSCLACGLDLPTHQHLFIAGMAEHYTETSLADPKDYYGIEFDPSEYYGEEYGNE
jgi:hypothetical protein